MKYFFIYVLFFKVLLFAQPNQKTDITGYYSSFSNSYIQENHYKDALINTQKAILNAEKNKNIKEQAYQNFYLGKLYFDLRKYGDAIEL